MTRRDTAPTPHHPARGPATGGMPTGGLRTDALIAALAADGVVDRPRVALRLAAGAGVALVALMIVLGLRPGLAEVLAQPLVAPKLILPLVVAALAMAASRGRVPPLALALPGLAAAALWAATLPHDAGAAWAAIRGSTLAWCVTTIPALALPIGAGLFAALRRMTVFRPARTGALAGAVAGGLAAAIYALHCTEDAPAFYALWYSFGIAVSAAVGAVLGARRLGV